MSNDHVAETTGLRSPLVLYGLLVAVLALLKLLVGVALVPESLALPLTVFSSLIFLALPLAALISGSRHPWNWKAALGLLLAGAGLHVALFLVLRGMGPEAAGFGVVGLRTMMEVGVMLWTLGLGALVSILIKEKNLLPPVLLFLAGFDVLIILTPYAPQAQIVEQNPEVVQSMGMTVPQVRPDTEEQRQAGAQIADLAYVGPADLFVTATLFAVLARYRMKFRESAIWIVPVLFVYLILALFSPLAGLPALVPIGATVLIVNRREFQMTKEEKQATWGVAVVAVLMAGYGIYSRVTYVPPEEPADSLPTGPGPALPESEGSLAPGP